MDTNLTRRRFLVASLASSILPFSFASGPRLLAAAPATAEAEAQGLTTYQLGPQIWVRWNNRLVTCYRAHRSQKYPYLYPVSGPATGLSLTAETALPWPHHRSLFFGCDRVNGGNYWQEDYSTGQIFSVGPKLGNRTRNSVEILDQTEWQKPGQPPVMQDRRQITVTIASERLHCIDWQIEWEALVDVRIQKTNHSLFALRSALDVAPTGGGRLLDADGRSGEKATFGQPSAWCSFYGARERLQARVVEGIAIFDHPTNLWAPRPWFTRDYGFISPTPLNFIEKPWELPAGKSVTLRYRVVLYAGDPEEARLTTLYKDWVAKI